MYKTYIQIYLFIQRLKNTSLVFGYVNHNGSVVACARLQNLTLEDSREISKEKHKCFQRLIDSKCPLDKMIEANINRDPEGNLDVEVVISR